MLQPPLKLLARARSLIRRTRMKYRGHGLSRADVLTGLERMYARTDPWDMTGAREQFRFERTSEILRRQLIPGGGTTASILEIGCGEGHQSVHLRRLCERLTAIDIVPVAIERARARAPDVEWVLGHLEDQPWVDAGRKFDIVTACEVLYAFNDIPTTLRLMSRLGNACLVTYFGGAAHAMEWPLRAVRLAGRESFVFETVSWTAVWWHPRAQAAP
jgi:SAM-dependent methyltransferase